MLGQVINGLTAGAGFGLAAVGVSFTFGVARVLNFAYGAMYMLAAYVVATAMGQSVGGAYWLAVLAAFLVLGILGYGFARLVMPIIDMSPTAVMIVALGVAVVIENLALARFGGRVVVVDTPLTNLRMEIANAVVSGQQLLTFVVAVGLTVGLLVFLRRTLTGTRIRAVAQTPDLAATTGVNVRRIYALAIVIGVLLAAATGAVSGPTGVLSIEMGLPLLLRAFTITVLAGLGRLGGALVIGLGVGVVESLFTAYISAVYAPAIVYGLLIVALIFMPTGIFKGASIEH